MATWEDVDLSLSHEDKEVEEEANLCLMANTSSDEEFEDTEIIESDSFSLQEAFDELLSNSSILSHDTKV